MGCQGEVAWETGWETDSQFLKDGGHMRWTLGLQVLATTGRTSGRPHNTTPTCLAGDVAPHQLEAPLSAPWQVLVEHVVSAIPVERPLRTWMCMCVDVWPSHALLH